MMGLDIKYSIANAHGQPATSKELVIMNWEADSLGQLF
jgi:DNA adenine methylase